MKIAIVGLGVIGGTFAMALKNAGYREVYGIDRNRETLKKALDRGLIIKGDVSGREILPLCDITILCIYPRSIKPFIMENRRYFKQGSIVTDTAGVKYNLSHEIGRVLPNGIEFIMGHPMAGREKQGIDFADDKVFKDANYILVPTENNTEVNLLAIEKLIRAAGFKTVTRITASQHDKIIAHTSQLPHAIAVALINSDKNKDTYRFTGDSYREITRIANINGRLWSELFLENKKNLLRSIAAFESELEIIKTALQNDDGGALIKLFKKSSKRRQKLINSHPNME